MAILPAITNKTINTPIGTIVTPSPVSERRSYDLPNELLFAIFDCLDDIW